MHPARSPYGIGDALGADRSGVQSGPAGKAFAILTTYECVSHSWSFRGNALHSLIKVQRFRTWQARHDQSSLLLLEVNLLEEREAELLDRIRNNLQSG
jgi:hypothetical protein